MRVLKVWSSLAEKHGRGLEDDDVVDIVTGQVVIDRGVLSDLPGCCNFGDLADKGETADTDPGCEAADNLAEDEEDDGDEDDAGETHPFPSTGGLVALRPAQVALLRTTINSSDADDLREFLKAEAVRRELDGGDDGYISGLDGGEPSEDELNFLPPLPTPAKRTTTPDRKIIRTKSRPPQAPASRHSPPLSSSPMPSSSSSLPPSPPKSSTSLSDPRTGQLFGSPTPHQQPVASTSQTTLEEIHDEIDLEFPPPQPRAPSAFARRQNLAFVINFSLSDDETEDERPQPKPSAGATTYPTYGSNKRKRMVSSESGSSEEQENPKPGGRRRSSTPDSGTGQVRGMTIPRRLRC